MNELDTGTLKPYQQRVIFEKIELDEKIQKLEAFFQSEHWNSVSDEEGGRLYRQIDIMTDYSDILDQRIAAFE